MSERIQILASLEGTRDDIAYALTVCVNALRSGMHVQRINGDWGEILILEALPKKSPLPEKSPSCP